MIRVKDKFLVNKILPPLSKRLHNGIKLNIISGVALSGFIEFLSKEGNWSPLLAKNCSNPNFGRITIYSKTFCPLEMIMLHTISQGYCTRAHALLAERGMTTQVSSAEITNENELYRKGSDDLLLLCPSAEDIKVIMAESHKGICGAHQSGVKMRWVLADALHPVTKPWPFRGWAVDIIRKICPAASNQQAWILVATDYFTKWVEAESYRSISSTQAEASNKVIKGILEKIIEEKPRAWHDLLPEAIWAYRVRSLRVTERPGQEEKDYAQAMAQELEDLEQSRLDAYNLMQAQNHIAARTKDPRFGKFSHNWEGPFIIERILGREQADDSSLCGASTAHVSTDRGHGQGRHSGHGCGRVEAKAVTQTMAEAVTLDMGAVAMTVTPAMGATKVLSQTNVAKLESSYQALQSSSIALQFLHDLIRRKVILPQGQDARIHGYGSTLVRMEGKEWRKMKNARLFILALEFETKGHGSLERRDGLTVRSSARWRGGSPEAVVSFNKKKRRLAQ
ncbi:unnamed protein product [Prunus armeniaca]|uniref:Uncharacterized protein n=1 Tax=Prunus armeniaca TaxID=36596 RepID=A0A6J5W0J5_PRUAR|nr:unnamed protein product [Prunus armeniaca]